MREFLMKICKKCQQTKSFDEFYKHSKMADGHLSFCKSCVKNRVNSEREANPEKHFRRLQEKYFGAKRDRFSKKNDLERQLNPIKYKARTMVANAIASGKLIKPKECQTCGNSTRRIEGHHEDYSKPLVVLWLCSKCHSDIHKNDK